MNAFFLELILTGDEKCLIYRKMLKEKRIFIHIVRQMVKFDKKINLNERIFFPIGMMQDYTIYFEKLTKSYYSLAGLCYSLYIRYCSSEISLNEIL